MSDEYNGSGQEEKRSRVNRRSFVKALGVTGVATTGLSSIASASQVDERDVEEQTGESRNYIINSIQSDPDANKLISEMDEKGWNIQFDEGNYMHVEPESEQNYDGAVIPFDPNNAIDQEDLLLVWMSRDMSDVDMPHVQAVHRNKTTRVLQSATAENEPSEGTEVSAYRVADDGENKSKRTVEKFDDVWASDASTDSNAGLVTPQDNMGPGGGGGCYCVISTQECNSLDWSCLVTYATAGFSGVAGASACLSAGAITALACKTFISTAIGAGNAAAFSCSDLADECYPSSKCITRDTRRYLCNEFN